MRDDEDWSVQEFECQRACCQEDIREEILADYREEALNGVDIERYWNRRPAGITIPQWCAAWRKADQRPDLPDHELVLYRGGGSPQSMSWTDNLGVALAFANHLYVTTRVYGEVIGEVRLPLWRCRFPTEAVLGWIGGQNEYIVDIERFPPVEATRYEPTEADVAAYRELHAPMLPTC